MFVPLHQGVVQINPAQCMAMIRSIVTFGVEGNSQGGGLKQANFHSGKCPKCPNKCPGGSIECFKCPDVPSGRQL